MRPGLAVGVEDAAAKQWAEVGFAIPKAKVLELERQDGLDVFRLNGLDDLHAEHLCGKGRA